MVTYNSSTCGVPNVKYEGGDNAYLIRLNEGNRLAFKVDPTILDPTKPDFVLALMKSKTTNGKCCVTTCLRSSIDFTGSRSESIPAPVQTDEPGDYYLYIDSPKGFEGEYLLTVSGTNPTPDLELTLSGPEEGVIAGNNLTYSLSVKNYGHLEATNVEITQCLPPGVSLLKKDTRLTDRRCDLLSQPESACKGQKTVVCDLGDLKVSPQPTTLQVTVEVDPDNRGDRGILRSTAAVKADQDELTREDNVDSVETPVDARSNLLIDAKPSHSKVTAGQKDSFTYTLTVENRGPSVARKVTIINLLHSDLEHVSVSSPCTITNNVVTCKLGKLRNGATTPPILISGLVGASARGVLLNRAEVAATEQEPGASDDFEPSPRFDSDETPILVETIFRITRTPSQDPVIAGKEFNYSLEVENIGRSNSLTTILDDTPLQPGLNQGVWVGCKEPPDNGRRCDLGILLAGKSTTVTLPVTGSPSLLKGSMVCSRATVTGENGTEHKSSEECVTVAIEADLNVIRNEALSEVCAGGNLVYTITVINGGPSNSPGGPLSVTLSPGLSFVSSPDGCTADNSPQVVTCTVPQLPVGKEHSVQIVALVAHTKDEVFNEASAEGFDDPTKGTVPSNPTMVHPDLVVSLSAASLVAPTGTFDYTVTVENRGPSDAEDVELALVLPSGGVQIGLGDIPDGMSGSGSHTATAPPSGSLTASAFLINPAHCGNTAEVTTAVTDGNGAALAVTLAADAQAVAVGDKLTYTIEVVNQGRVALPTVTITDELPPNTLFKESKPTAPDCAPAAGKVVCSNLALPATVTIAVQVQSGAQTPLTNKVFLGANTVPDATIETPILPFRLLLPFFEVGENSNEVTTLVAVRNSTNSQVGVKYAFLNDPVTLPPHVMDTRNLRDFFGAGTGYVAISPDPPDSSLGGDFIRVDPTPGTASGGLLVPATEMCREWSVRFLNGGPLEAGTDFLFFAPGNSACPPDIACPPVATGKVFTEKGQYLQDLTITKTEEAFRIRSQDLDLLANFGSIEWTFREGLAGHVAAVHREKGKDEVAVPGHCRRGAVTPALILPFFEAAPGKTLVAIRNESEKIVTATFSGTTFDLAAHATKTLVVSGGHAQVDLVSPAEADISGDFLLIGPGQSRAGGALVRPTQLCRCWDIRFMNNSQLLFYVEGSGTATGKVYTEDGGEVLPPNGIPTVVAPGTFRYSAPPGKGAIEWDLGEKAEGYVAALLTGQGTGGDDYSVLVPGLCRPCP